MYVCKGTPNSANYALSASAAEDKLVPRKQQLQSVVLPTRETEHLLVITPTHDTLSHMTQRLCSSCKKHFLAAHALQVRLLGHISKSSMRCNCQSFCRARNWQGRLSIHTPDTIYRAQKLCTCTLWIPLSMQQPPYASPRLVPSYGHDMV